MRAEVVIRPATEADARALAAMPRLDDARECAAIAGMSILDGALFSLSISDEAVTALAGGQVICMFGVGHECPLSGIRAPWLLGTRLVDKHAGQFLRTSRPMFKAMQWRYPALANYVDARAARTIRWLSWLGFTIGAAEPMGVASRAFRRFSAGAA